MFPLIAQLVEQLALNQTVVGSSPTRRTKVFETFRDKRIFLSPAQVAKLVDALVLGTSGAIRGGSSPLLGTQKYPFIGYFHWKKHSKKSASLINNSIL